MSKEERREGRGFEQRGGREEKAERRKGRKKEGNNESGKEAGQAGKRETENKLPSHHPLSFSVTQKSTTM